jgi:hypothetical protein
VRGSEAARLLARGSGPLAHARGSASPWCSASSFTLTGQTSGATLHFRIAAIDPSQPGHMTTWSAWVAGTVH